ncbi:hypothetical protein BDP81DRAFT_500049 [Colletotrichum phormii]|uniref:Uncharacterized protein n=1 Tax=Colletotrichum phormii TaxID=359342 RepID=A0AAI9ZHT2_9PEZI|nr:uncharacterized protein BDP81DRAFT_500049 [Colletotrichum phormii]KAK1624844.1 hypothetical protein BDP81DRAFT_500049 [Colletotrichum phormii]
MKHTKACLLAAAAVSASSCAAETNTGDRVIQLGKGYYNGTTKVQFTTEALGEADFFKIDPGPNATTFDSWYFDAMNPSTNETVVFNFEVQRPTDNGADVGTTQYHVSLYGVNFEMANIIERADKSMRVDFFGGSEVSWSGSSLLQPRPVYNVTINSPETGIYGSLILRGNTVAPHYTCGTDAAGVNEKNVEGVAWANALPDAEAAVDLKLDDTTIFPAAFWGHARLGPYAVVWWHSHAQDGTEISSEYLATYEDGHVIASRCVDRANNTLGWGEGQIWPLVPGTPAPAGMIVRWDLGDAGVFVANITSKDIFVTIPFWQAGRGPVSGGFVGGEQYTDETGLWSLNQLPKL